MLTTLPHSPNGHLAITPREARTWTIHPSHHLATFTVRHNVFHRLRGRFADVAGHGEISDGGRLSLLAMTIATAKITSDDAMLIGRPAAPTVLDAATFPVMTITSSDVHWYGLSGRVHAVLTARGNRAPVTLDATYDRDAAGAHVITVTTVLDRSALSLDPAATAAIGRQLALDVTFELTPLQSVPASLPDS